MRSIKIIAWLGAIIMTGMIIFSIVTGDFVFDGGALLSNVWGQMSIVDLYVGFILFYLWIFKREKRLGARVGWFVLLMVTGSLATALYILKAAYTSKNETEFFLG